MTRKRRASTALTALMVVGPTGSAFAATGSIGANVDISQASPATRAIESTPATMMLRLGSHGDAVAEVQRQLGIPTDAIFGPLTDAAVREFQASNGLDVDGVVGPVTWTALFGLQEAAVAAGAANGDVAVIVRERDGGGDANAGSPDAPPAGTVPAIGGGDRPNVPATAPGAETDSDVDRSPRSVPVQAPAPADGACGSLRLGSPVKGTVTSNFGPRWGRNHDGIDIAAPTGTAIRAAECGIVSFSGVQSGYGDMVCIEHSSRFETCYAHMSRKAVSQGQRVGKGQVIGYVGCTGTCTGPHLHFETRVDGSARDPRPYLNGGSVPGAPTVKAATTGTKAKSQVATAAITSKSTTYADGSSGGAAAPATATTAVGPSYDDAPSTEWQPPTTTTAPAAAPPTPHVEAAPAPQATTAAPAPAPAPPPVEPTTPAGPTPEQATPVVDSVAVPETAVEAPEPSTPAASIPAAPVPAPTGAPAATATPTTAETAAPTTEPASTGVQPPAVEAQPDVEAPAPAAPSGTP